MSQVSPIFRRTTWCLIHWCPACEELHALPYPGKGWTFNDDLNKPTFSPSFKHGGKRTVNVNGKWTGEWVRDEQGKPVDGTCHYVISNGMIHFCQDSWHKRTDSVAMPLFPADLADDFGLETKHG